jgi:dTDP-glucose 4,6-dehydratase
VLVTGGAGFIGATVCDQLLEQPGIRLINFDKLTYAANPDATVREVPEARYSFVQGDVCDREALTALFATYQPDAVIHLAAETHVDRSIMGAPDFVMTNLVGTQTLLDVTRDYWQALDAKRMRPFRLIHVSTDEVFGTLTDPDLADESTPYAPRSPYAATKAGADQLAEAARITHGLPVTIAYGTNAYRPGHDRRYGLDPTRIETDFGWAPLQDFETGLAATVDWYLSHPAWWQATIRDRYNGERLGL